MHLDMYISILKRHSVIAGVAWPIGDRHVVMFLREMRSDCPYSLNIVVDYYQ